MGAQRRVRVRLRSVGIRLRPRLLLLRSALLRRLLQPLRLRVWLRLRLLGLAARNDHHRPALARWPGRERAWIQPGWRKRIGSGPPPERNGVPVVRDRRLPERLVGLRVAGQPARAFRYATQGRTPSGWGSIVGPRTSPAWGLRVFVPAASAEWRSRLVVEPAPFGCGSFVGSASFEWFGFFVEPASFESSRCFFEPFPPVGVLVVTASGPPVGGPIRSDSAPCGVALERVVVSRLGEPVEWLIVSRLGQPVEWLLEPGLRRTVLLPEAGRSLTPGRAE